LANNIFGDIPEIKEGDAFQNRQALRNVGIHLQLMAGIDGNPDVGASSIVLNGGYVDDEDLGDEIIYTGHGGNDPKTGRQIRNQSWDSSGNKALIVSEMHGLPVRVSRGFKHKSPYSPKSGYRYGGLYKVIDHFEEKGKDGFQICRFRLEKIIPLIEGESQIQQILSGGSDESERVSTTVLRIIRDTKLSRKIKQLYNYECQICGIIISVCGVRYAEAAHIRPLGIPHNGKDKPGNLICLCPNHHLMFDKGMFAIEEILNLIGIQGKLKVKPNHKLEKENLDYHKQHVFTQ